MLKLHEMAKIEFSAQKYATRAKIWQRYAQMFNQNWDYKANPETKIRSNSAEMVL